MVLRAHAHAIEEAAGGAGDQAKLRAHRARVQNHLLNPVLEAARELPDLDTPVLLLPCCTALGSQHASNKCLCPRVLAWLLAAIATMPQHEEHAGCVARAHAPFTACGANSE